MRTEKTRMLRSGEVAKRLGLHPLTVRRWVKEGKIAAVQIGCETLHAVAFQAIPNLGSTALQSPYAKTPYERGVGFSPSED
jgi:excisionase family DNA binding protein